MNAIEGVKASLSLSDMIVTMYLSDLTDADLLVRAVPGTNHIAWQVGHLITSENQLVEAVSPGAMPALPEGFAAKHTNDTAGSDAPADFYTRQLYVDLMKAQRQATLTALEKLSESDLDRPAPEFIRSIVPTVGSVYLLQGSHWLMHAGQWAVVRRKLGRPPLM